MSVERLDGIAFSESSLEGYEAWKAIDGSKDTSWRAQPYYKWWLLELRNICKIDTIIVKTGCDHDEYYHYFIEYSIDRINWDPVAEKTDDRRPDPSGERYQASVIARYVRITITYCSSGQCVGLMDVDVQGEEIPARKMDAMGLHEGKVKACLCDKSVGFTETNVTDNETGLTETVMTCCDAFSYLLFPNVVFSEEKELFFQGYFGFVNEDRSLIVEAELRLDFVDGPVVGRMKMFRQYTLWSHLACDISWEDGRKVAGTHNLYFAITKVDSPQILYILWVSLSQKPRRYAETIDYSGVSSDDLQEYHVYFGNLHAHTGFSDGEQVPEYAYDYARYTAQLDFLAITEHSNLFDDPFDSEKSKKWRDLKRFAEKKTEDGRFLALIGSETTWYNQFGHMNIYGADFFVNAYELGYNDVSQYFKLMESIPGAMNQWNHPWSCGSRQLDILGPYDPEFDKVLYTMEMNHMESPERDGLYYYIHALDKGWHIAPVGNQDNHQADWGTINSIRTGLVAHHLTKKHLYDAMRHYRLYYTSAPYLKVIFRMNDFIMGSFIRNTAPFIITVKASNREIDPQICRIEVIGRGGEILYTKETTGNEVLLCHEVPVASSYYFVKVYQTDGEFAVTAPVWIEG